MKLKNFNNLRITTLFVLMVNVILVFTSCDLISPNKIKEPDIIQPKPIVFKTVPVTKANITDKLLVTLEIIPKIKYDLSFTEIGGYIKNINFKVNDKVKKGDIIASFDVNNINFQIKQQELTLKSIKLDIDNAKNLYDNAVKNKEKDLIDTYKHMIKKANISYELGQLQLNDLYTALNNSMITAPVSGTIIYLKDIAIGNFINPKETLCTIADDNEIYYKIKQGKYQFNQDEKLEFIYNNEILKGIVEYTPENPINSKYDSFNECFLIKPTKINKKYNFNKKLECEIIISERDNVLTLPMNCITAMEGKQYIYVIEDGVKINREVKIGINDGTICEITKGVKEDELVLLK